MYDELILRLRKDAEFLEISSKYNNTVNEFAERISQAADAIEKISKQKWIPVTERLPEDGVPVLATYIGYNTKKPRTDYIVAFDVNEYEWRDWIGGYMENPVRVKITHWMPLPEPPK